MARRLILVLGGVRSGKSAFAEELARSSTDQVLYVATLTPGDEEMRERVAKHRQRRPASWSTVEIPLRLGQSLHERGVDAPLVLVDCLSVLISNILLQESAEALEDAETAPPEIAEALEKAVLDEVEEILACYRAGRATFIVVSNETGLGVIPPYPTGRLYRDLLGLANQKIARESDEVYMLLSGIPIELKALSRLSGGAFGGQT